MKTNRFYNMAIAAGISLALTAQSVLAVEATAISAVNVRTGPGTSYAKVDTLHAGEQVDIAQCEGSWCFVQRNGPDGWVSGKYLAASGSGASGSGTGGSAAGDAAAAAIRGVIIGGMIANSNKKKLPYGPDTCKSGFVWRDAIPGDHVCVVPARRSAAANENAIAGSRVDPTGPYGPNTCKPGFVWREAYSGDVVCVTPARRTEVKQENIDGPSHRVNP